jgi:N-acetylglucosaminylphosphatidylinositol deacetylase
LWGFSEKLDIDILITFDNEGITSHANHISLYYGALHWLKEIDPMGSVTMYSLRSTNVARKYISLLDAPWTIAYKVSKKRRAEGYQGSYPTQLVFMSNITGHRTEQRAMTLGHQSQMLCFRYGWLGLSRYVSINDLEKQTPSTLISL